LEVARQIFFAKFNMKGKSNNENKRIAELNLLLSIAQQKADFFARKHAESKAELAKNKNKK
jgi:hypothetical protein